MVQYEEHVGRDCVRGVSLARLGASTKHAYFGADVADALLDAYAHLLVPGVNPRDVVLLGKRAGSGKSGAVYSADVGSVRGAAIVKTQDDATELRREAAVMRMLHRAVGPAAPNFVLLLGEFRCVGGNEPGSFCSGRGPKMAYLLMERVESVPGQSLNLRQLLSGTHGAVSFGALISILAQLLLALRAAQRACRFTHYDLHSENVMIKGGAVFGAPGRAVCIHYPDAGVYVTSPFVATMIDFGYARVEVDGRAFSAMRHPREFAASDGISEQFSAAYDATQITHTALSEWKAGGRRDGEDVAAATRIQRAIRAFVPAEVVPAAGAGRWRVAARLPFANGRPIDPPGLSPDGILQLLATYAPRELAQTISRTPVPGTVRVPGPTPGGDWTCVAQRR